MTDERLDICSNAHADKHRPLMIRRIDEGRGGPTTGIWCSCCCSSWLHLCIASMHYIYTLHLHVDVASIHCIYTLNLRWISRSLNRV